MPSSTEILETIQKENEGKIGILCLNCLIVRSRFKEIYDFMETNNIPTPEDESLTKLELLDLISIHLFKKYQTSPDLQMKYSTFLTFIGDTIKR